MYSQKIGKILLPSFIITLAVVISLVFALSKTEASQKSTTLQTEALALTAPDWFLKSFDIFPQKITLENTFSEENITFPEEKTPYTEADFQRDTQEIAANDVWKILLTVEYRFYKNQYIPQFSNEIKAYENKTVTLKGYMYPLEDLPKQDFFILSYYPIAQCFFCGGAGPESVIEINAQYPIKVTQKPITVKGKLKLNADDPERLFYILLDAELIE